jgi:hypothetical protein
MTGEERIKQLEKETRHTLRRINHELGTELGKFLEIKWLEENEREAFANMTMDEYDRYLQEKNWH